MRFLYKYPQAAFPYAELVDGNRGRSKALPEYELIDTGVFAENRYFDVFVDYAKAGPDDVLIRITACNRGPEPATLHLLPTLWFRNTWSWIDATAKPLLQAAAGGGKHPVIEASHDQLGPRYLFCESGGTLLFTENETNFARLFGSQNTSPYVKDAFHVYLVDGDAGSVNPDRTGTKAAAHYRLEVPAGDASVVRLRLSDRPPAAMKTPFGKGFDAAVAERKAEADAFYEAITPPAMSADEASVMRQALAGMLWSKQYFHYDVATWLAEHGVDPMVDRKRQMRNRDWSHMVNEEIISMPDKWEYP
jgi:hypothetical protein